MPKVTRVPVTRVTQVGNSSQRTSRQESRKQTSVLDRIKPIGFADDEGIQVLLYGRSATGKTTLAGTFPTPSLWLLCSGGMKPGELRSIDTPANRGKISSVTLERSSEVKELVEAVDGTGLYRTLVLDHVSGLEGLVLKEVLGLAELPPQKSWGLASMQQYGQCTLQCKELLISLLSLRCNLVLIAHERTFNADSEHGDVIQPHVSTALTPSLAGWLVSAVDYVGQTFLRQRVERKTLKVGDRQVEREVRTGGVEYCLRTGPDATYATKFRVPRGRVLPDVLVDPDYGKMLAIIRGHTSTIED